MTPPCSSVVTPYHVPSGASVPQLSLWSSGIPPGGVDAEQDVAGLVRDHQ